MWGISQWEVLTTTKMERGSQRREPPAIREEAQRSIEMLRAAWGAWRSLGSLEKLGELGEAQRSLEKLREAWEAA